MAKSYSVSAGTETIINIFKQNMKHFIYCPLISALSNKSEKDIYYWFLSDLYLIRSPTYSLTYPYNISMSQLLLNALISIVHNMQTYDINIINEEIIIKLAIQLFIQTQSSRIT